MEEKAYELASTFGAGVLGFGLGALLSGYVQQFSLLIILVGLVMHSLGMYALHARREKVPKPWVNALYWLCWAVLAGLAIYVIAGLL